VTSLEEHQARTLRALNKLCKWRSILAGWQLGTRASDDPTSRAVRDHREATMTQEADLDALMALLVEKDRVTEQESRSAQDETSDRDKSTWSAVREHRETTLRLRAELNALTALLMDKEVFTQLEWLVALERAAGQLDRDMEQRFPGARTSDMGVHFFDVPKVETWLSKFPW
jgi:hypothetical protein